MTLIFRKVGGFKDGTNRIEYSDGLFFIVENSGEYNLVKSMKKDSCDQFVDSGLWTIEEVEDSWTNVLINEPKESGDYFAIWESEINGVKMNCMHVANFEKDTGCWSVKNEGGFSLPIVTNPTYFRKNYN